MKFYEDEEKFNPYDFASMATKDLAEFIGEAVYPNGEKETILAITGIQNVDGNVTVYIGQDDKCSPQEFVDGYSWAGDDTPCGVRA